MGFPALWWSNRVISSLSRPTPETALRSDGGDTSRGSARGQVFSRWISGPFVRKTHMGVSENVVYPIVPNGFADHSPVFKNG